METRETDTSNVMEKSPNALGSEDKKLVLKGCILCEFTYMTVEKVKVQNRNTSVAAKC